LTTETDPGKKEDRFRDVNWKEATMLFRRTWPGDPGYYSQLSELDRVRREMERLFESFSGSTPRTQTGLWPAVNVSHDHDNYYVRTEIPGVKASDLEVTTTRNALSLAGKRTFVREEEKASFHRREREEGSFRRTITLPGEVNGAGVEARYVDGVLEVTLPKAEAAKPKQIPVKTS
jgi:HSP20 family protein